MKKYTFYLKSGRVVAVEGDIMLCSGDNQECHTVYKLNEDNEKTMIASFLDIEGVTVNEIEENIGYDA